MGRSELGQVVDPAALDAAPGSRARLEVSAPASWMACGAEIAIEVPARLECARCDGGGCDACQRSGALRVPGDAAARSIRVSIPERSGGGVALRLVRPFGDAAGIEQLIVEVRGGPPSPGVTRIERRVSTSDAAMPRLSLPLSGGALRWALAIAVALAALAALLSSR